MELATNHPRVVCQLADLNEGLIRRQAAEDHALVAQLLSEPVVKLVAVAVALLN
jgi:hypothetical protein